MSDGIRSGVNCTRLNLRCNTSDRVLTSRVLASPGTPTSRQCPCASRAINNSSMTASCPTMTFLISCRISSRCLAISATASTSSTLPLPPTAATASSATLSFSIYKFPSSCSNSCRSRCASSSSPNCAWQVARCRCTVGSNGLIWVASANASHARSYSPNTMYRPPRLV